MKIRALAIPAGMALFAFSSFAQITGIEGIVKADYGKPLQGAIIKIHRTDIKGDYSSKPTDKMGHYIYNGLPYGKYDLTVWVADKQVDELRGVQTRPGDLQQLNFDLKADKAPSQADANKNALAQKAMEDGQISAELARQFPAARIDQPVFLQRQHDSARGSTADRFEADQVRDKWIAYDQTIFTELRASLPIESFASNTLAAAPEPVRLRAAYLKRAAVMFRRQLWDFAFEDLRQAVMLGLDARPTAAERGIARAALAGKINDLITTGTAPELSSISPMSMKSNCLSSSPSIEITGLASFISSRK